MATALWSCPSFGVLVYGRTKGPQHMLLQFTEKLEGWTYIVLVCTDNNRLALWVNGKAVASGANPSSILPPGVETKPSSEQFSSGFEGNLTGVQVSDKT